MRGINVIIKGRKTDNYGYLKLSVRRFNKTIIYSLNIKVLKKDFNPKSQRMRISSKDNEYINTIIEKKILEHSSLPDHIQVKGLCEFIEIVINRTIVNGTKQKYQNILNLFKLFIEQQYKKNDLYFNEINSIIISDFYVWLRKRNTNNTTNYKIKSFKSFFSKLEKEGIYKYLINPFNSLNLKFEDTKKDYLTVKELNQFINSTPNETRLIRSQSPIKYKLQDVKDSFLFSTFSQGLRISDILTLRLNDFVVDEKYIIKKEDCLFISKKMIKTKKNVVVYVNQYSSRYIENQIIRLIDEYIPKMKNSGNYHLLTDSIEFRKEIIQNINNLKNKFPKEKYEKNLLFEKQQLYDCNMECFYHITILLNQLCKYKETKTKFLFPFLDNEMFKNIGENNDFGFMSENQYLQFQGRRSYVNNLLNKMINITSKNITFHSSRHTYTTLVLDSDIPVNMYELQKSLGHSTIVSTMEYIRNFNTDKLKNLNQGIVSKIELLNEEAN